MPVDRLLLDQPGYLHVPAASGDKADTPDHADFAITADIDIRVLAAAPAWGTLDQGLVSQWNSSSPSTSAWSFYVTGTTKLLRLLWNAAGTTVGKSSTVAPGLINGQSSWLRVTLDVDNLASGNDVTFYTSTDPITTAPASVSWTQLGTTVTTAGVTSIFDSTNLPTLGSQPDNLVRFPGDIYYAEVRNGIGGTVVADPDFRVITQQTSSTTLTDDYAKAWTVRGAATWSQPAGATDSYMLEDGSGVLVQESSVPDVFIPHVNPMPPLLAQ